MLTARNTRYAFSLGVNIPIICYLMLPYHLACFAHTRMCQVLLKQAVLWQSLCRVTESEGGSRRLKLVGGGPWVCWLLQHCLVCLKDIRWFQCYVRERSEELRRGILMLCKGSSWTTLILKFESDFSRSGTLGFERCVPAVSLRCDTSWTRDSAQ